MKKTTFVTVAILIIAFLVSSCYTYRPSATTRTGFDNNMRMSVQGAGYTKKKNALGITLNIGIMGLGGYAGYALQPFQRQTENGKEPVHAANIAVGTLLGASIALLTDRLAGRNNTSHIQVGDRKWLEQVNPQLLYLEGKDSDFSLIHRKGEGVFQAHSVQDLMDFKYAFPNSPREAEVLQGAMPQLARQDLPTIIDRYSTCYYIQEAKKRYIELSQSLTELLEAKNRYSDILYDYERMGASHIANLEDIRLYYKTFPQGNYNSTVFQSALKHLPPHKLNILVDMAPQNTQPSLLEEAKLDYIFSHPLEKMEQARQEYPEIRPKQVMERVYALRRVSNLDSLQAVTSHFAYVPGITEKIVSHLLTDLPVKEYGRLLHIAVVLKESMIQDIKGKYFQMQKEEYDAAIDTRNPSARYWGLKSFINKYIDFPHDAALMATAQKLKDYNYCYHSPLEVVDCAQFVAKYPEYFKEIDQLVYKAISSSPRTRYLEAYKSAWPKGAYQAELDKLWERAASLDLRDEMIKIKEAQQRAADAQQRAADAQQRAAEQVQRSIQQEKNRECSSCRGSGRCRECGGAGYDSDGDKCYRCDGTGVCNSCNGLKKLY